MSDLLKISLGRAWAIVDRSPFLDRGINTGKVKTILLACEWVFDLPFRDFYSTSEGSLFRAHNDSGLGANSTLKLTSKNPSNDVDWAGHSEETFALTFDTDRWNAMGVRKVKQDELPCYLGARFTTDLLHRTIKGAQTKGTKNEESHQV